MNLWQYLSLFVMPFCYFAGPGGVAPAPIGSRYADSQIKLQAESYPLNERELIIKLSNQFFSLYLPLAKQNFIKHLALFPPLIDSSND